ncbi:MAG: LruC domain-containing protein [Bacteroidales bacterium]|nr:LruC domain-containing protein [Bacteroidales bacterium]
MKFRLQVLGFVIITTSLYLFFLTSCKKKPDNGDPGWTDKTMDQLIIERVFNWSATQDVNVTVEALDNAGNHLPFVRFDIYSESLSAGGYKVFSGTTYRNGNFETMITLPVTAEYLTIATQYNGQNVEQKAAILDKAIHAVFAGLIPDTTRLDSDWDGVPDIFDDYPLDTLKAFNSYFPGENQFATLIFEDSWPATGDFDFNDMVIRYRINLVTDFLNHVNRISILFIPEASGTKMHNGFGFRLLLDTSFFAHVTGARLNTGLIDVDEKGFEKDQKKATVIAFDDALALYGTSWVEGPVNTDRNSLFLKPDTVVLTIDFKKSVAIPIAMFGTPPYNPFIFVNGDRAKEIHLPDFSPTDKADITLFGTYSDNSNPAIYRFYKSRNNLPWALFLPVGLIYLDEGDVINKGYLKFNDWAESSGKTYPDWYKNTSAGYRNPAVLYSH